MFEIFQYDFIIRAFEAGIIVAIVAPVIGVFLVLKGYSLIADTLSHVSLAGVAVGLVTGFSPFISAIIAAVLASFFIERLRIGKRVSGESALAIFLSGSLALAVVIIGIAHGFNVDLFNYLFGSLLTVTARDVLIILVVAVAVLLIVAAFFKELVYVTFDEEAAKVSGVAVRFINILLIVIAAFTVSLSIPTVGVLLISSLVVIPVSSSLLFRVGFLSTILVADAISVFSVICGILASYYFNLSPGGSTVLVALAIFCATLVVTSLRKSLLFGR